MEMKTINCKIKWYKMKKINAIIFFSVYIRDGYKHVRNNKQKLL